MRKKIELRLNNVPPVDRPAATLLVSLAAVLLFTLSGCRAGGDLKNEEHFVAAEQAEIAAEIAAANPVTAQTTPDATPSAAPSAGPPSSLKLTSVATSSPTAGVCFGPLRVTLLDASGAASVAASAYAIALKDGLGGLFYSASTCTTAVSTVTVPKASTSVDFYYRTTAIGTAEILATQTALTPGALNLSVGAGSVASISLALGTASAAAGTCNRISYSFYDSYGNLAALAAALDVTLQSTDVQASVHSSSTCTSAAATVANAAGVTGNSGLYYLGKTARSFTLTASASALTSSTAVGTTTAGSSSWFAWTGSTTVSAAACATLTLSATDAYANSTVLGAAVPITLATSSGSSFYLDSLCSGALTSTQIASGKASVAVYFKSNTAGTASVTATASGFANAEASLTVVPGSAQDLGLSFGYP
ncbi:MAG: hypothetical protein AAB425_07120, partial [Bdellovibrionota bacterium]